MFVISHLKNLVINILTIGACNRKQKSKKSFLLINDNPNITKKEFLKIMGLEEVLY